MTGWVNSSDRLFPISGAEAANVLSGEMWSHRQSTSAS